MLPPYVIINATYFSLIIGQSEVKLSLKDLENMNNLTNEVILGSVITWESNGLDL